MLTINILEDFDHLRFRYRCKQSCALLLTIEFIEFFLEIVQVPKQIVLKMNVSKEEDEADKKILEEVTKMTEEARKNLVELSEIVRCLEVHKGIVTQIKSTKKYNIIQQYKTIVCSVSCSVVNYFPVPNSDVHRLADGSEELPETMDHDGDKKSEKSIAFK